MNLIDRVQQEIKAAMLAKDAERLGALRMLKSAIGYAQIEKKTDALPEAEVIALVQKEIKKRRDSVEQYQAGGRPELADKETREIVVLQSLLPPPLSEGELDALVRATIQELGASTKKDMGPVVKAIQAEVAGRADGKTISAMAGKLLA
jgi:uncharacterized protein YqeY